MTAAPDMMPENTSAVDKGGSLGQGAPGSTSPPTVQHAAANKTCPPPHYQVLGEGADPDSISMFYMTVYKIALCPKPYSHDWGACPYAHDKENARRREPTKFQYSSCICPNSGRGGACPNGLACQYSHTLFEYWLHPMRYRTQMCRSGTSCNRSLCFFAHTQAELRAPCQPMVLLERQQQQQMLQQPRYIPAMGFNSLAAAAGGAVRPALGTYGLMQLRNDVSGWPFVVDPNTVAGSRQVLLGGMPGQIGAAAVGAPGSAIYALGSAPDLTVSDSSNSSSTALMFVPGQAGVPATMLSLPAQQQQQGLLRPSEYLLLKQQQWQQQQQQLQQVSPAQLEALQLQMQQQQLGDHQAGVQAGISSLPAAGMTAPYMTVPVPEAAATSTGVYVQPQQYPQSYMIHAAGGDVISAVSSGLCMLPRGV